ncbi:hypothetical protein QVD17_37356 [Tagetes erecta]|uniref:Wall-associated receptor kinase galacturonan-binding domain-containing protein n=1 Tax=Tagetes erecta TaxID=13708 RepID=A0AAD8JY30_TARER|nr:hypothetical protein QVD17_37356 [Tagetes erecta]
MFLTKMNKLYQFYTLLTLLSIAAIETLAGAPKYAKDGCDDKCGNVRIPYPFGIGENCAVNEWYTVDCNSSTPYLRAFNHLQVLGVDIENQTVTVNTPMISDCSQTNSVDLGSSPFFYSDSQNIFVFEGCGNAVMMDNGSLLTGCSTTCGNDSSVSDTNNCLGVSCCQTTIPYSLKSYSTNLTGLRGDISCRSAFLVHKDSYLERRLSIADYVPISLLWTLSDTDLAKITCFDTPTSILVFGSGGTSVESRKCTTSWYLEGNPYLVDGCQARIDTEECARCVDGGGLCYYVPVYGVDDLVTRNKLRCCPSWSRAKVDLDNVTSVEYLKCLSVEYKEAEGNTYILDELEGTDECAKCRNRGRYCNYDYNPTYDVDGVVTKRNITCDSAPSLPVYYQHQSKSSLGVIVGVSISMVELLTREKPVSRTNFGEHRSLVTYFMEFMEEGRVLSIFDAMIVKEGTKDELLALANIAMQCLNQNGKYRPTMKKVATELESIRASHIPSMRS